VSTAQVQYFALPISFISSGHLTVSSKLGFLTKLACATQLSATQANNEINAIFFTAF
jgi:hypothetical protein